MVTSGIDYALKQAKRDTSGIMGICENAKEYPTVEDIRLMTGVEYSPTIQECEAAGNKYPNVALVFKKCSMFGNNPYHSKEFVENFMDVDARTISVLWSKNKQVYSFDNDFLDELLHTENSAFAVDSWDYLPYKTFFLDLSKSDSLVNCIGYGIFVHVEKTTGASYWKDGNKYVIHTGIIVDSSHYYPYLKVVENKEHEYVSMCHISNITFVDDFGNVTLKHSFNKNLTDLLVYQILTYLSSVEPDVQESDFSKRTYRKPNANFEPKNKLSEVRQWNVGDTFGISYRKWKKEQSEKRDGDVKIHSSRVTGRSVRPHARRAHWSHYWYGTGENKVRRPKWVAATFVNAKDSVKRMVVTAVN